MNPTAKTLVVLGVALLAGALAQQVIDDESTELGLSKIELSLLGSGAGAVTRRMVREASRRRSSPRPGATSPMAQDGVAVRRRHTPVFEEA
jgi:hypothetical protein